MDVAEVDKVAVDGGGDCEDETVGKLSSRNLNRVTGYLIPDARQTFN